MPSLASFAPYAVIFLGSYLLGAIPIGLLVGKLTRGIDLRRYGSGRTGATNAWRVLGLRGFVVVSLGDFVKGLAPVLAAGSLLDGDLAQVVAGLGALAGHTWSVFLGFQGGRGVATGLGALVGMAPTAAVITTVVGVIVVALSRYMSLGSLAGTVVGAAALTLLVVTGARTPVYLTYAVLGACIVIFAHRDNIQRLLAGTERRLGDRGGLPPGSRGG